MLKFLVVGRMRDPKDADTQRRRSEARDAHLARAARSAADGILLLGGPIFDVEGEPLGSALVVEADDRAAVEAWLREDPYYVEHVWQDLDILEYRIPPYYTLGRLPDSSR